jgi:hypothetical protein
MAKEAWQQERSKEFIFQVLIEDVEQENLVHWGKMLVNIRNCV